MYSKRIFSIYVRILIGASLLSYYFFFFKGAEIIYASTPTPSPPSVSDSPDPQKGGSDVSFSCSGCSAASGETIKLFVCRSNDLRCILESEWSYKVPITINNTQNSNSLTDYQILVTMDTNSLISAGKMRDDCGDIRFFDPDNTSSQLNYWIESGCNSTNTKIWVKVPSISAGSTKTIYMYYGNPNAQSESDGNATFLFFDDFTELPSSPKWSEHNPDELTVYKSIVNGTIFKVQAKGPDTNWHPVYWVANLTIQESIEFRIKLKWESSDTSSTVAQLMKSTASDSDRYLMLRYNWYDDDLRLRVVVGGTATTLDEAANVGWRNRDWFIFRGVFDVGKEDAYYEALDGSLYYHLSGSDSQLTYPFYLSIVYNCKRTSIVLTQYWDWIFVRKYTDPEPTVSIGSEQTTDSSSYLWTKSSTAVSSDPSATYTCPSCTYSINTYYGATYSVEEGVWTSFTSSQTFTCKKENTCACSENTECYSGSCKQDPDGSGAFCCNSDQCSHDGSCSPVVELSSTGASACVEGENIDHNSAGNSHPNYAVFDGQLYYCGTSDSDTSPYPQVTNLIPGDQIGICKCKFDGTFECSTEILKSWKGGRFRILS